MGVLAEGAKLTLKQIRKKIKDKKKAERKEAAIRKAKRKPSKREKYYESLDARTKAAEQKVEGQGGSIDFKEGGRLNDGTAFIKSLYKDKL